MKSDLEILIAAIYDYVKGIVSEVIKQPPILEPSTPPPSTPEPALPTTPGESVTPAPPSHAVLSVSRAAGKRGDVVEIEIDAQTSYRAEGFAMAIGYESMHLEFLGADWSDFLLKHAKDTRFAAVTDRPRGAPKVGNAGAHVILAYFFVDVGEASPISVLIPPSTLLATLKFRIKDSAQSGRAFPLLNRNNLFGDPRVKTLIPPSEKTPELVDGSITVEA